jgi:ribosomal protein L37AE/L43A
MRRVIRLTPEHTLRRAAKRFLVEPEDHCPKCESTFVRREPAFIHCRYCGNLARIANASLADQELYELRSGLRLAS